MKYKIIPFRYACNTIISYIIFTGVSVKTYRNCLRNTHGIYLINFIIKYDNKVDNSMKLLSAFNNHKIYQSFEACKC